MRLAEIGLRIRQARVARRLTQAQLAKQIGIARPTLNQLENGLVPDLGLKKVLKLFEAVGLDIIIAEAPPRREVDHLRVAASSASVGFKTPLTEDELLRAFLTGRAPDRKRPHLRRLLEETPPEQIRRLIAQVSGWTRPGRVEKNVVALAKSIGALHTERWIPSD